MGMLLHLLCGFGKQKGKKQHYTRMNKKTYNIFYLASWAAFI